MVKENPRDRILELDILRGLAAFAVVLFHYTVRFDQEYSHVQDIRFHFWPGQYGVHLFFMISGFVIFMTLDRTKHWLDFVVSRFSRLFPAYWLGVCLTFLATSVAGLAIHQVSLTDAVINLSMLQSLFYVPDVDGVYWTLILELCFYVLIFMLHRARLLPFVNRIIVGWLLLQVAAYALHNVFHVVVPDRLETVLLLRYAHLFAAGIMFYKIWKEGASIAWYATVFACLGVHWVLYDFKSFAAVALFFVVFYFAINGYMRRLVCRPLVFLGTISYTLYLIHQNVGYIILNWMYTFRLNPYVNIATTIVAVVGLASAMTFLVERPALKMIRTQYKKIRYGYPPTGAG